MPTPEVLLALLELYHATDLDMVSGPITAEQNHRIAMAHGVAQRLFIQNGVVCAGRGCEVRLSNTKVLPIAYADLPPKFTDTVSGRLFYTVDNDGDYRIDRAALTECDYSFRNEPLWSALWEPFEKHPEVKTLVLLVP